MALKKTKKKVAKKSAKKTAVKKSVAKRPAAKKSKKKIVKKKAEKTLKTAKKKTTKKTTVKKPEKKSTKKTKTVSKSKPAQRLHSTTVSTKPKVAESMMKTAKEAFISPLEISPYKIKKGEEYMNATQREHFRKILILRKQQLMQEVDSTVVHMKEEATPYADPLDRASQEAGFSLELRTRDRERKLIKKIEQAIDLLDAGEYGYCESCGAEIGIRRLEARPTADKCIDCKTFEEIRERQSGI